MMSSRVKYALVIFVVLLLATVPMAMQRERGSIAGVTTNDTGPIAKASVEARNVMSGAVFRTQSDAATATCADDVAFYKPSIEPAYSQ